jgi:TPP-dependent pyruvate/acetoin dehydrogenase alpha subunit
LQLQIERDVRSKKFKIPVHLAMGHEAIAVAIASVSEGADSIFLTHRNIHFQIALGASLQQIRDEYLLEPTGLGNGKMGSMNLTSPHLGNLYTSNILGNTLAVATGAALACNLRNEKQVIWAITGDGAIEEGVFYESILIAAALNLPILFVVENNEWSLASSISERRKPINLSALANAMSVDFLELEGNNVLHYAEQLNSARDKVVSRKTPMIIQVNLTTLGGYFVEEANSKKRYVNYHSGSFNFEVDDSLIIEKTSNDPVFVLESLGL